jgi:hypothetical protein
VKGARRAARAVALRGEPYGSGFTSSDIDVVLAAQGFNCHEHARTPVPSCDGGLHVTQRQLLGSSAWNTRSPESGADGGLANLPT